MGIAPSGNWQLSSLCAHWPPWSPYRGTHPVWFLRIQPLSLCWREKGQVGLFLTWPPQAPLFIPKQRFLSFVSGA